MRRRAGSLQRDTRGVAALEFALVGGAFLTIILASIEIALLFWTQNALQSAAGETARCVAIGSSACSSPGSYAVGIVNKWMFPGVISSANVASTTSSTCNGASGTPNGFQQVTITSSYFTGWLPSLASQFANKTITASACYPR